MTQLRCTGCGLEAESRFGVEGRTHHCGGTFERFEPAPSPHAEPIDKRNIGLYSKFRVERTDGRSAPGEKHEGCQYFVLDVDHDPHALPALEAYAKSCATDYPALARDLKTLVAGTRLGSLPPTAFDSDPRGWRR